MDIKNKKAYFNYFIEDEIVAGIVLQGTEIKSIRKNSVSFNDSYCVFENGELFVKNLHISEYKDGTYNNHEPLRLRKLLLHKKELRKLNKAVEEKRYTIVPTHMFIDSRGFAKLKIGLARGKKQYDKRNTIKENDIKRYENDTKR
jgi:SsrA-binding protein